MKNKHRVLHIINSLEIGGAQRLLTDLLTEMAQSGNVEIGVVTIHDSKDSILYNRIKNHEGISVYDLSAEKLTLFSKLKRIRKLSKQYHIVHSHLFPSGYLSAIANVGRKKPIIYTEHSTHNRRRERKAYRVLERLIYKKYRLIAGISEPTTEALNKWLLSKKIMSKTFTIPNGVKIEHFLKPEGEVKEKINTGKEGKGILMISRFTAAKDQETLIRALVHIPDESVHAVFIGDGETLERHKTLAKDLGVAHRCLFLGKRNHPVEFIHQAFIGVQSSHWEGFGLTAIEMMAGGLPVIASDVPGLREVVKDAGLIFPKGDEKKLAETIMTLCSNPEEYDRIKQRCGKRALDYDISRTAKEYLEWYDRLIGSYPK